MYKRSARYFSLVELLVVIAIIGILASLMMPSLIRAMEQAVSLQCVNTQRGLMQANLLYSNDWNMRMPQLRNQDTSLWWTDAIAQYMYPEQGLRTGTSNQLNLNGNEQLGRQMGYHSVLSCPKAIKASPALSTPSYARNRYLYNSSEGNLWYAAPKLTQCQRPANVLAFADCKINAATNFSYASSPYFTSGMTNGMHMGDRSSFSWLDGHATMELYLKYSIDPYIPGGAKDAWNLIQ